MSEVHGSKLTAVRRGSRNGYWLFRCECGVEKEIRRRSVAAGHTKSCGCSSTELKTKHGKSFTKEYYAWAGLRERCSRKTHPQYADYGGRGITVCARWDEFTAFIVDMGTKPAGMSIDRIDNDKGYWCGKSECSECGPAGRTPNCRWTTPKENSRNRRSARLITYGGRTQCLSAWAEKFRVSVQVLFQRLKRNGVDATFRHYIPGE